MNPNDIKKIEEIIGYEFRDKNFLITAFTHVSYSNEFGGENNEKLEFLGDSILNFVVAEKLFYFGVDEGQMTLKRALLVSREPLKIAVERLDILKFYRLGKSLEPESLSTKFVSNLFETIVAAIYLDGGIKEAKKFILKNLVLNDVESDSKSRLQEILQKAKKVARYECETVAVNPPVFRAKVIVDGKVLAIGEGRKKRDAEKAAAKAALRLKKIQLLAR